MRTTAGADDPARCPVNVRVWAAPSLATIFDDHFADGAAREANKGCSGFPEQPYGLVHFSIECLLNFRHAIPRYALIEHFGIVRGELDCALGSVFPVVDDDTVTDALSSAIKNPTV